MSHEAKTRLDEKSQLELIQKMTDLLFAKFSSQFVFPALGHEDAHARRNLTSVWGRWLPTDSITTFVDGKSYRHLQMFIEISSYYENKLKTY